MRERFRVDYTLAGLDVLLHRIGWSVQVPARRTAERDEAAIAAWREGPTTFRRFDLAAIPVCDPTCDGWPRRKRPSPTPGQRRWRMARAWHARFTLAGRYSTCWNP